MVISTQNKIAITIRYESRFHFPWTVVNEGVLKVAFMCIHEDPPYQYKIY